MTKREQDRRLRRWTLLLNVKRVDLTLTFAGYDVPEYNPKKIVARSLIQASPLRGFAGLSADRAAYKSDQRTHYMKEVREALGCK